MLYATIFNTSSTDYSANGVDIASGETLVIAGHHIANMKIGADGIIYHIDLGHSYNNPWSNAGHGNVPAFIDGHENRGLLLTVRMPREHLVANGSHDHFTN